MPAGSDRSPQDLLLEMAGALGNLGRIGKEPGHSVAASSTMVVLDQCCVGIVHSDPWQQATASWCSSQAVSQILGVTGAIQGTT